MHQHITYKYKAIFKCFCDIIMCFWMIFGVLGCLWLSLSVFGCLWMYLQRLVAFILYTAKDIQDTQRHAKLPNDTKFTQIHSKTCKNSLKIGFCMSEMCISDQFSD
jgi:hypothetical protein